MTRVILHGCNGLVPQRHHLFKERIGDRRIRHPVEDQQRMRRLRRVGHLQLMQPLEVVAHERRALAVVTREEVV